MCDGPFAPGASWAHVWEHSGHLAAPNATRACLIPAVRYSTRLIDELGRELRRGQFAYCELRAASACARLGKSGACAAASLRGHGLLGPFNWFNTLREKDTNTGRAGREPCELGRLFHKVVAE